MIEDALVGFFGVFQKKHPSKNPSPQKNICSPQQKKHLEHDVFSRFFFRETKPLGVIQKQKKRPSLTSNSHRTNGLRGNKSGRAADFIASLKLGVLTDFEVVFLAVGFFGRVFIQIPGEIGNDAWKSWCEKTEEVYILKGVQKYWKVKRWNMMI